jgi:hypothetical protein
MAIGVRNLLCVEHTRMLQEMKRDGSKEIQGKKLEV